MLSRLREHRPNTPLPGLLAYAVSRLIVAAFLTAAYRMRSFGSASVPRDGAVLLVANHQSYLDPPAVGVAVRHRHLDYLARAGLFESKVLGTMLTAFNSVPISEDGGDTRAIKEILRRLGAGRAVLIFPEGTRSPDGAMRPFKRGIALLVKRAQCPVVPVAVEGCYDAWPRDRAAPSVWGKRIAVKVGAPIAYEELLAQGGDAALERLAGEIDRMRLELRAMLRKQTRGRFPAAGPADEPRFAGRGTRVEPSGGEAGALEFRAVRA
jgi:1-acyl-sn-glycerol-3-phosphate acyltransferase